MTPNGLEVTPTFRVRQSRRAAARP